MADIATDKKKVPEGTPPKGAENQPPDGRDSPPEVVDPYKGTDLEGKSPQEISALFGMSAQVTKKQQEKVRKLEETVDGLRTAPPAAPLAPKKDTDLFSPGGVDDLVARLEEKMAAQIKPLQAELSEAKSHFQSQGVHDRMAQKYDDWFEVKPYIDNLIAMQNFPDPNDEGLLESLYYTAVGMMAKQGITTGKPKAPEGDPPVNTQPMIPQHRSSPPPPAPKAPGKETGVTWEDLDATETVLCKASGMQPEEFKFYQDMDERDVAESEAYKKPEGA